MIHTTEYGEDKAVTLYLVIDFTIEKSIHIVLVRLDLICTQLRV